MDKEQIKKLLQDVKSGDIGIEEAFEKLRTLPYDDLGFAKIDTHRELRKGLPEVVFCEGKTIEQIVKIVGRLKASNCKIIATRASHRVYQAIKNVAPEVTYYETAKIVADEIKGKEVSTQSILVVTGGTADIPVAEEAAVTAELMGNRVERLYDVGVAGVHRLLGEKKKLFRANVLVVVAGMDGVLPSIVGGLVTKPVIAVPTSVGYGASFQGLAALLTMLNSCAPGVAVVNIDNGFGAGYFAGLINRMNTLKVE